MSRRTQNSFIKKKKADLKRKKRKEKFEKKLEKSKLKKEAKDNGFEEEGLDPVFGNMLAPELRQLPEVEKPDDKPEEKSELQTINQ